MRQCPTCRRKWPSDWDYCPECAVWVGGSEATEHLTRLVPVPRGDATEAVVPRWLHDPASIQGGIVLACEIRCQTEAPDAATLRHGSEALRLALEVIRAHGGTSHLVPEAGAVGRWGADAEGAAQAARAAAEILAQPVPGTDGRWQADRNVSLRVGIAGATGPGDGPSHEAHSAFRLASRADGGAPLVSQAVYERTVTGFDYRGVCPPVPRANPLPAPVFELLGPKPERSGTHHDGPERTPLVGRAAALAELEAARRDAAAGRGVVLHLIGGPGAGKSKLLREWMAGGRDDGRLAGWLHLHAHGVPYGGQPLRVWERLTAPLLPRDAAAAAGAPGKSLAPAEVLRHLHHAGRNAFVVVDDLHWADGPSLEALGAFLEAAPALPALVILAYRPSFEASAPPAPREARRCIRLAGVAPAAMRRFVGMLAEAAGIDPPSALRDEIVAKAGGNPLYAEEAIAHLADIFRSPSPRRATLAPSLPEMLIQRIQWTVQTALPNIEHRTHAAGLVYRLDRGELLGRLDELEERLAAWLDRFDVMEEEAPPIIWKFLQGLESIDGQLALLSLFLGRQRPHCHRLAQALARLGARHG